MNPEHIPGTFVTKTENGFPAIIVASSIVAIYERQVSVDYFEPFPQRCIALLGKHTVYTEEPMDILLSKWKNALTCNLDEKIKQ